MNWCIGQTWEDESKGLKKVILDLKFQELAKPTELARVNVLVECVKNPNDSPSQYLQNSEIFEVELGTAVTPLDCYIEILLQKMLLGEKSQCCIKCSSGKEITFHLSLEEIISDCSLFKLNTREMYSLATKYKECGVKMFKEYPIFAHKYFCRAAKCLISFKPFQHLTVKTDGMDGSEYQSLLQAIQTNIAACLLLQNRDEHALYVTDFVDSTDSTNEKSIYRRATAYYNLKEYEKAIECIKKAQSFKEKKEFLRLYGKAKESLKTDEENYKNIVQKMFT